MNGLKLMAVALVACTAAPRLGAQDTDSTSTESKTTTQYVYVSLGCFNLDPNKMAMYVSSVMPVEGPADDYSAWDAIEEDVGRQAKDELRANGAECIKLAATVFRFDTRGKAVDSRRHTMAGLPSNVHHEAFEFEYVEKGS